MTSPAPQPTPSSHQWSKSYRVWQLSPLKLFASYKSTSVEVMLIQKRLITQFLKHAHTHPFSHTHAHTHIYILTQTDLASRTFNCSGAKSCCTESKYWDFKTLGYQPSLIHL